MKLSTYDTNGKKLEKDIVIDEKVLGKTVNTALLAQAMRVYTVNSHQHTSKVKTRGEVSGSTRKIYRQKGTGNARHGAKYAPIFVGGGVAHGPEGIKPNVLILPKKMRRSALASALLLKVQESSVIGLSGIKKSDGKTTTGVKLMNISANHPSSKVLVITRDTATPLFLSLKNIQGVIMKRANLVSAFDVIGNDKIVLTKAAWESLATRINSKSKTES